MISPEDKVGGECKCHCTKYMFMRGSKPVKVRFGTRDESYSDWFDLGAKFFNVQIDKVNSMEFSGEITPYEFKRLYARLGSIF